jgi:hypothetical protein
MSLIGAGIGDHTAPASMVKGVPLEIVAVTVVVAITARYLRCLSTATSLSAVDLMLQPRKLVFMYSPYKPLTV